MVSRVLSLLVSLELQLTLRALGFSTSAFDLSQNIAGDSRAGLDERTLTEVRRIMEREHCDFDEARLIHTNRMFKRNGESQLLVAVGGAEVELTPVVLQESTQMGSLLVRCASC